MSELKKVYLDNPTLKELTTQQVTQLFLSAGLCNDKVLLNQCKIILKNTKKNHNEPSITR